MSVLSQIDKLFDQLKNVAAIEEMSEWWSAYTTIKYAVEDDASASKYDRETVDRLGTKLSELMTAIRDNLASPDKTPVLVSLGTLRGLIASRTVGANTPGPKK